MSVTFAHERIVEVPLTSPDNADPNTGVSVAGKTFDLKPFVSPSGRFTEGHNLYVVGKDAAAGAGAEVADTSVTYTTWVKDEKGASWTKLASETATQRALKVTKDVRAGLLFIQVTAATGTSLASVILRVTEM